MNMQLKKRCELQKRMVEMKKAAQIPSPLFLWDQIVQPRRFVKRYQWVQMARSW
jgi:hypothetical protein